MKNLLKQLKENISADAIGKDKDGLYVFRKSFFYTMGKTAEMFKNRIVAQLEEMGEKPEVSFQVISYSEVWKPFRGGASVKAGSHWCVKVKFI